MLAAAVETADGGWDCDTTEVASVNMGVGRLNDETVAVLAVDVS